MEAQVPLAGGQDLLVEPDSLADAARRLVGVSEVVTRVQRVGMIRAKQMLMICGHLLADRNSLRRAVAEDVQEYKCPSEGLEHRSVQARSRPAVTSESG